MQFMTSALSCFFWQFPKQQNSGRGVRDRKIACKEFSQQRLFLNPANNRKSPVGASPCGCPGSLWVPRVFVGAQGLFWIPKAEETIPPPPTTACFSDWAASTNQEQSPTAKAVGCKREVGCFIWLKNEYYLADIMCYSWFNSGYQAHDGPLFFDETNYFGRI
jgi:hypothetical protein